MPEEGAFPEVTVPVLGVQVVPLLFMLALQLVSSVSKHTQPIFKLSPTTFPSLLLPDAADCCAVTDSRSKFPTDFAKHLH